MATPYQKGKWDDELECLVRYCPDCDDWWPATREFFYTKGRKDNPKLHSYCKACYKERRKRYRRPYVPRHRRVPGHEKILTDQTR